MPSTQLSAAARDIPASSDLLVRAFMDDPIAVWVAPPEQQRERALRAYFRMALRYSINAGGRVDSGGNDLQSAAIWLSPGRTIAGTVGLVRAGLLPLLWSLGVSGTRRFFTFANTTEKLHKEDVKGPHWYLWVLGVDPPYQGKGVGGETMQPVLREADVGGLSCYLETAKERNLAFYRKHGFEVVKEQTLGMDGPIFWTMLREPVR